MKVTLVYYTENNLIHQSKRQLNVNNYDK